jgi:hypothetical protein
MEDDLKKSEKMEDDLKKIQNGTRPQKNSNGRRPQKKNGRRPQTNNGKEQGKKMKKWKTT